MCNARMIDVNKAHIAPNTEVALWRSSDICYTKAAF